MMTERGQADSRWREVASWVGALFLGGVLVLAVFGKLGEPVAFVEQVREEGLDFLLPANLVVLLALGLEMALGLALVLGSRNRWVLLANGLLIGFFLFLTARNYYLVLTGVRDAAYDCGCFGVFLQRTAPEAFWQDLLILVPPFVLATLSRRARITPIPGWKVAASVVAGLGIMMYTSLVVGLPQAPASLPRSASQASGVLTATEGYSLWIAGEEEPGAQVFESDVDLLLAVRSDQLDRVLLLDVRTSRVFALAPSSVEAADGGLRIPSRDRGELVGTFEVGGAGLLIDYAGRSLEIRMG
jgi:uncharacterized membrane protein YphA (DoxX/SURF4 family)